MNKIVKKLRRAIFSRLYLDIGSEKDLVLVLGAGRSGTTWLADLIAQTLAFRLIFEPFWHLHLKVDGVEDFFHHRYVQPEETKHDDAIRFVLSGEYRKSRIIYNSRFGPYHGRVIKDICSSLMVEKIAQMLPEIPIFFVVRHPCAVVLSRLEKKDWHTPWGLHSHLFFSQPDFMEMVGIDEGMKPDNELEDHAISYCCENFLPITTEGLPIHIVCYESLFLDVEEELSRALAYVRTKRHVESEGRFSGKLETRYWTANPKRIAAIRADRLGHLTRWKRDLSEDQIRRVYQIVENFRLGGLVSQIDQVLDQAIAADIQVPRPIRQLA